MKKWEWIVLGLLFLFIVFMMDQTNSYQAISTYKPLEYWILRQPTVVKILLLLGTFGFLAVLIRPRKAHFVFGFLFTAYMYLLVLIYGLFFDRVIDGDTYIWDIFFGYSGLSIVAVFFMMVLLVAFWKKDPDFADAFEDAQDLNDYLKSLHK